MVHAHYAFCNLSLIILYEFEAFLFVMWYSCFEENRVDTELCAEERHVTVDAGEEVETFVSLLEVAVILRQCLWASRTPERPP